MTKSKADQLRERDKIEKKRETMEKTGGPKFSDEEGKFYTDEERKFYTIRNSNAIAGIDMNGDDLRVYFKSGNAFDYEGVGQEKMHRLLQSNSPGRFFALHIRGQYQGRAVHDDPVTGDDGPEAA